MAINQNLINLLSEKDPFVKAGNYGQAAMAGLSMIPGPVGWAGLGGEMILGAHQKNPIPKNWQQNVRVGRSRGGIADLYRHGGFSG